MRLAIAFLAASTIAASAESVDVKYRGPVDLAPFVCRDNPNGSFVKRTCYDTKERYMLILLNRTWYHYCELDAATYAAFIGERHMGTYYAHYIKGSGQDGPFDCRTHPVPSLK